MKRDEWDIYYLKMAKQASTRSTCLRRQVGAVAVRNKRLVATGYNGPPPDIEHCGDRGGCYRELLGIPSGQRLDVCRAVHGEQNLIIQCTLDGRTLNGCTIYCTHKPCFTCAKLLVSCGISHIVYIEDYPDEFTDQLLLEAKISTKVVDKEVLKV